MSENHGPDGREDSPGAQRSSAGRWVLAAALVLVIAAAGVLAVRNAKSYFKPKRDASAPILGHGGPLPSDMGSEDADLKIEACVGGCITFVAVAIADAVEEWPDEVRAEFYAYESDEGQAFVAAHDEGLACIFFNGENCFTIEEDGVEKEVHFCGPPGQNYTLEDLAAVLRQQWEEVHGELPEGFEEKLAAMPQAGQQPAKVE